MIKLELIDTEAQAMFVRLASIGGGMRPLMQEVGEHLTETTKQRFQTSTAPDGTPWAPNSQTTYLQLLGKYKGGTGKDGRLNKKGAARASGKKPLIGETRSLATTINYEAGDDYVQIGSPMIYSAVQQFGAKGKSFTGGKTPWGDIPARPFLGLSPADQVSMTEAAGRYVDRKAKG